MSLFTRRSRWYRAALAGAVVVVLLNTWLAARSLGTLLRSQQWLAHTLEVIATTDQLLANVRAAESTSRGYILTGSTSFLDEYQHSVAALGESLKQVQQQTADNAAQQQKIAVLRQRVQAKLAALDVALAIRRGQPNAALDPALLAPLVEDTAHSFQGVQASIQDIQASERTLLAQRTQSAAFARRSVRASFALAFVLDFVLLLAAFQLLVRVDRDRCVLEEGAREIANLNTMLQASNAELEDRVAQRTRELAFSNQELEAFSYSVSHDLRAPLRTIDGFSLALLEDFAPQLNDEGRDYIRRVRSGVQRMGTLIDALLQLSRVTRSELLTETVDLSELGRSVFRDLAAAEPARTVEFVAQPGVVVQGDPRLLRIALENLIGNAWKFTSRVAEARIELGSELRNGLLYCYIRDNGAGFDMQYVDRLFTAFQRLHGDREFKGSGIGLATVSRILRRHNGSILAEGRPGEGATFYFHLAADAARPASHP